jgi:hypothetical protein
VENYQLSLHGSGLLVSEKQWLWECTCYRSEMLKHSLEKLNFIPKKKRNERQGRRKSKILPASIPHFPAETTFWSKLFYNTDVVIGFSEQNFP